MEKTFRIADMESDLLLQLERLLKEAGFETHKAYSGEHAITLSGRRGSVRAVVHFADREMETFRAIKLDERPHPDSVRMKAGLPVGAMGRSSGAYLSGSGGSKSSESPTSKGE